MLEDLKYILEKIKVHRSIVLNYSNHVTLDFMANVLSAIGASPIMSFSHKEAKDLVKIANGININIGTLDNNFIKTVNKALKENKNHNKVCVLDPVGAGASDLRKKIALKYLNHAHIIKGNESEIFTLANDLQSSHGIDSTKKANEIEKEAKNLALKKQKTIIATGKTDLISNEWQSTKINYGSEMMPNLVGTGCVLGAIICAFATVENNHYKASLLATLFYTILGQESALKSDNIVDFKNNLLKGLEKPNWDYIESQLNILENQG